MTVVLFLTIYVLYGGQPSVHVKTIPYFSKEDCLEDASVITDRLLKQQGVVKVVATCQ